MRVDKEERLDCQSATANGEDDGSPAHRSEATTVSPSKLKIRRARPTICAANERCYVFGLVVFDSGIVHSLNS
jgi:hypothetical protein